MQRNVVQYFFPPNSLVLVINISVFSLQQVGGHGVGGQVVGASPSGLRVSCCFCLCFSCCVSCAVSSTMFLALLLCCVDSIMFIRLFFPAYFSLSFMYCVSPNVLLLIALRLRFFCCEIVTLKEALRNERPQKT